MSALFLDVSLTKKGLENYDQVVESIYQYCNNLRDAGPQEWLWRENNKVGEMQF